MNWNEKSIRELAGMARRRCNRIEYVGLRGVLTHRARTLGMRVRRIGEMIERNHSTVSYYSKMHAMNLRTCPKYRELYDALTEEKVDMVIKELCRG